jgi:hypothetical protein
MNIAIKTRFFTYTELRKANSRFMKSMRWLSYYRCDKVCSVFDTFHHYMEFSERWNHIQGSLKHCTLALYHFVLLFVVAPTKDLFKLLFPTMSLIPFYQNYAHIGPDSFVITLIYK